MWSLGCLLAELYLGLPLFPGGSSYDQISKIHKVIKCTILYEIRGHFSEWEFHHEFSIRQKILQYLIKKI